MRPAGGQSVWAFRMQERRYRPGDVLDDYCPRERRITDHAIVAMIEDEIRRTRCGICDAEHEYKEGKVPAPRRKTQPPALFNQVLDNLNGSTPKPQPPAAEPAAPVEQLLEDAVPAVVAFSAVAAVAAAAPVVDPQAPLAASSDVAAEDEDHLGNRDEDADGNRDEGGFRRSLIRATFPRPEGQAPPQRAVPEFTLQSLHNRRNHNQRHAGGQNKFRGGRRRQGGGSLDHIGPMRFRDHGHGQGPGQGHGQDRPQSHGGGRRRRGGKKNR